MGVLRFIARVIGWLVTIILQIAASFLIIFIFSVVLAGADTQTRVGWLALIFMVWLGYVIGINLVGYLAFKRVWHGVKLLTRQRLVGSAVGAFIPLLFLLVIGYSVPVGAEGTRFYDLVTNNWQPILAQASLFAAILGYYVPGILKLQPEPAPA